MNENEKTETPAAPEWHYVRQAMIAGRMGTWWRVGGVLRWIRDES